MINKIGIFSPSNTKFYEMLLEGFAEGFQELGIGVFWSPAPWPPELLNKYCQRHNIQAIMEINRARDELPGLLENIPHICWIQDPSVPASTTTPSGSDITYTMHDPSCYGMSGDFLRKMKNYVGILHPGSRTPRTKRGGPDKLISDFSIAGGIPSPMTEEELQQPIHPGIESVTIEDLISVFLRHYTPAKIEQNRISIADMAEMANNYLKGQGFTHRIPPESETISYIHHRVFRGCLGREMLTDAVLNISDSTRIFGPHMWGLYEKFKPYYRGFLTNHDAIDEVYRTSRINIHDHAAVHFRVVDCLAAGGFMMVRESFHNKTPSGIRHVLIPHEHYVPFTLDNLDETAKFYLEHEEKRREIARRGQKEVLRHHTWRHRAQQILHDISSLCG